MNRTTLVLLPFLLLALWSCGPQSSAGLDDCNSTSSGPDQRIAACTRLIDSAQLSSQDRATAFHSRGTAWADKRNPDRAIADYNEALSINPLYAMAYFHRFMAQQKQHGDAGPNAGSNTVRPPLPPIANQKDATGDSKRGDASPNAASSTASPPPPQTADPKDAAGYNKRGIAWAERRDYDRAIADYNEALRIDPQYAFAYYNRGNVWNNKGDYSRALADYNEALRLNPQAASIHNSAAWLLATAPVAAVRNGARAVELARKAVVLSNSKDADILDTLAAAYAEAGVFSEAIRWQEKSLEFPEFAKTQGDAARKRLELYRKGLAYHQPPKS